MNSVIYKYLLSNYIKTFFKVTLFFYCFGVILNLFEEIEFFKNLDVPFFTPIILTSLYIPGLLLQLLPFIIFISSMKFLIDFRNNRNLLTIKIFGFSNLKIFLIIAFTSFVMGWFVLFFLNPATSAMSKYYEKIKANYSRDIDHLISFNKNGLWIKESIDSGERIVTAIKPEKNSLIDVTIFQFDKNFLLKKKIISKVADIKDYSWTLTDVTIFEEKNSLYEKKYFESYQITSIYNYDKIINLFNNSDTLSFINLVFNYEGLIKKGYNKEFLNQSLHSMLVFPFFLSLMTGIASILTMHAIRKSGNFKFIIVGLVTCVIVYYLKDLSLALGKTGRIPITLSIWTPVIALSLFTFAGILQINEK